MERNATLILKMADPPPPTHTYPIQTPLTDNVRHTHRRDQPFAGSGATILLGFGGSLTVRAGLCGGANFLDEFGEEVALVLVALSPVFVHGRVRTSVHCNTQLIVALRFHEGKFTLW